MPALVIRHVQDLKCVTCGETLASAGSRSTITSVHGAIILFDDQDPPIQLVVSILCSNGHRNEPPSSVKFEMAGINMDAPQAANAVALRGKTRSGRIVKFE